MEPLTKQEIDDLIKNALKVGDSIRINDGLENMFLPSQYGDLSGFQGRIFEVWVLYDKVVYEIAYDSITLKSLEPDYFKKCKTDRTDFACYTIHARDVVKVQPRDTVEETTAVRKALGIEHQYLSVLDELPYIIFREVSEGLTEPRYVPGNIYTIVFKWCRLKADLTRGYPKLNIYEYFEPAINSYRKKRKKPPMSFTAKQKKMPWDLVLRFGIACGTYPPL